MQTGEAEAKGSSGEALRRVLMRKHQQFNWYRLPSYIHRWNTLKLCLWRAKQSNILNILLKRAAEPPDGHEAVPARDLHVEQGKGDTRGWTRYSAKHIVFLRSRGMHVCDRYLHPRSCRLPSSRNSMGICFCRSWAAQRGIPMWSALQIRKPREAGEVQDETQERTPCGPSTFRFAYLLFPCLFLEHNMWQCVGLFPVLLKTAWFCIQWSQQKVYSRCHWTKDLPGPGNKKIQQALHSASDNLFCMQQRVTLALKNKCWKKNLLQELMVTFFP